MLRKTPPTAGQTSGSRPNWPLIGTRVPRRSRGWFSNSSEKAATTLSHSAPRGRSLIAQVEVQVEPRRISKRIQSRVELERRMAHRRGGCCQPCEHRGTGFAYVGQVGDDDVRVREEHVHRQQRAPLHRRLHPGEHQQRLLDLRRRFLDSEPVDGVATAPQRQIDLVHMATIVTHIGHLPVDVALNQLRRSSAKSDQHRQHREHDDEHSASPGRSCPACHDLVLHSRMRRPEIRQSQTGPENRQS